MTFVLPTEWWERLDAADREKIAAVAQSVAQAAEMGIRGWASAPCGVMVKMGAFELPGGSPGMTGGSPVLPKEAA